MSAIRAALARISRHAPAAATNRGEKCGPAIPITDLRGGLLLLAFAWGLLAAQGLLARGLGEARATFAIFAAIAAAVAVVRPRAAAGRGRRAVALLAAGLVAGAAGWTALDALGLAGGDPGASGMRDPWRWAAVGLLAPVFEELLYRERLLVALDPRIGRLPALLITSGLFAAPHLAAPDVLRSFGAGLVLGTVLLVSGSVAPCIGLHAGLNLAALAGRA